MGTAYRGGKGNWIDRRTTRSDGIFRTWQCDIAVRSNRVAHPLLEDILGLWQNFFDSLGCFTICQCEFYLAAVELEFLNSVAALSMRNAAPITRDFMTDAERAACVTTASGEANKNRCCASLDHQPTSTNFDQLGRE